MMIEPENNDDNLMLNHYRNFLAETAKSLGLTPEEVAQIDGFQTPAQVNNFIDYLVANHGVLRESLTQENAPKSPQKTTGSVHDQAVDILKNLRME